MKNALLAVAVLLVVGCTAVTVDPLDPGLGVRSVCIQRNPKVIVEDFLDVVRAGFRRHGISAQVVSGSVPRECEYVVTYTALRSWDGKPYLSHAEIRLERLGRPVAYAEYHLRGKGGLSLTKWGDTASKMDPVLDELLAGYR